MCAFPYGRRATEALYSIPLHRATVALPPFPRAKDLGIRRPADGRGPAHRLAITRRGKAHDRGTPEGCESLPSSCAGAGIRQPGRVAGTRRPADRAPAPPDGYRSGPLGRAEPRPPAGDDRQPCPLHHQRRRGHSVHRGRHGPDARLRGVAERHDECAPGRHQRQPHHPAAGEAVHGRWRGEPRQRLLPRGSDARGGQHRGRVLRRRLRLHRHASLRRRNRLPLAFHAGHPPGEPRARDHRRAAA